MTWLGFMSAFTIVGLALVLVVDALAAKFGGEGTTISELTLAWSTARPVIAAGLSFVLGHLEWPLDEKLARWKHRGQVGVLWAAAFALWLLDAPTTAVVVPVFFSAGHLLWGQKPAKVPSP